jgi:hypothetical protein
MEYKEISIMFRHRKQAKYVCIPSYWMCWWDNEEIN